MKRIVIICIVILLACIALLLVSSYFSEPVPLVQNEVLIGQVLLYFEDISEEIDREKLLEILGRYYVRRQLFGQVPTNAEYIFMEIRLLNTGSRAMNIRLGTPSVLYRDGNNGAVYYILGSAQLIEEVRGLVTMTVRIAGEIK